VSDNHLDPAGDGVAGTSWLFVAAGFHFRGGMEKANAAMASYLLDRGASVHVVAHSVDPLFLRHPHATIHLVPRPLNSFALGEFGLDRRGREVAQKLLVASPAARVVVNGGNCQWPDINWVHYVHHAWTDTAADAPLWFKAKHRAFSARWRRSEKAALRTSRIVIANSELTRSHLLTHLGLSPDRVRTIYLGADRDWGPVSGEERVAARRWLGLPNERPAVAFIGGLGLDRRKGFDTLWTAWRVLCAAPEWDADLVVAGSGADAAGIAAAAERAGLTKRVRILGHSDRIRDVLAGVDLIVSPVRYEPYGLNVHEALCRGVPALVTFTLSIPIVRYLLILLRLWHLSPPSAWRERIAPLERSVYSGLTWQRTSSPRMVHRTLRA
jgi:glycosyltransferase involved in cell wall biosynthesis